MVDQEVSDIKRRIESVLIQTALSPNAKAVAFGEKTTGQHAGSQPPPGAFSDSDAERVEEILARACADAERLLGVTWQDGRLVARQVAPFDEREWAIHVLANYRGVRNRMVAAQEDVEYYLIRDLRKRYGFDGYGNQIPNKPTNPRARSVVEAVLAIWNQSVRSEV